jgi:hypothetical protein
MDWVIAGMAGQVLLAIAAMIFFRGARRLWAASLLSTLLLAVYFLELPMSHNGGPDVQAALTAACVLLITAVTRSRLLAAAMAASVALGGVLICLGVWSMYGIHFTSYPSGYRGFEAERQALILKSVEHALETSALPPSIRTAAFAVGPLPLPLRKVLKRRLGERNYANLRNMRGGYPAATWQTYLTGIYYIRHYKLMIWYPGGQPGGAVSRLEFRATGDKRRCQPAGVEESGIGQ